MKKLTAISALIASTTMLAACGTDRHYHDHDGDGYYEEREERVETFREKDGRRYYVDHAEAIDYYFDRMDLNGDGKISRSEHAEFADANFDRADMNNTGYLSRGEVHDYYRAEVSKFKPVKTKKKVYGERTKKGSPNVDLPNRTNANPTEHSANPTNPSQHGRRE